MCYTLKGMNEKQLLIYFLSQFDLAANKVEEILSELDEDFSFSKLCSVKLDKIVSSAAAEKILSLTSKEYAKIYLENLKELGIKLICKLDEAFPEKLLPLEESPFFLFYKGDLSLLKMPSIAIVGSRMPSAYGRMVSERFARELAQNGVAIISGLAYGVDSIAHRSALECGGKTIAVLGSGLNNIYPAQHSDLAREIAEKGLLLSEYCPSSSATKYSFPARNRIIAGLSDGVLITEASLKSGTLYTRDFALDYGKDVYAVPGNIDNPKSALPNEIICSGQGMGVSSSKAILENLHIENCQKQKTNLQLSFEEDIVVKLLETGAKELEEIEKKSNLPINILSSCLTMLEIRGIISRMPGGLFCLK